MSAAVQRALDKAAKRAARLAADDGRGAEKEPEDLEEGSRPGHYMGQPQDLPHRTCIRWCPGYRDPPC